MAFVKFCYSIAGVAVRYYVEGIDVYVKGSNRSVLQLTKASLSLYIDREK